MLLAVVSFLTDLSSETILPLLPLHLTALGATGAAVGLVGGLGDAVADLLKVFSGYVADRLGRRKPLVVAGYALSAGGKLLFPLATSWQQLLVFRPLERVGKGLRSAPRDALIADLADPAVRGHAFGFHRAMDTAGAIAGTCLGLVLVGVLGLSVRSALLVGAILAFAALPLLVLVREEARSPVRVSLRWQLGSLPGHIRRLLLVGLVFGLGKVSYMFFLLQASRQFPERLATVVPLVLYLWFNLVYTLTASPAGRWSDRAGRRPVLLTGLVVLAASSLGVGLARSALGLAVFFAGYGVAHGLLEGNLRALVGDLSPASARGTSLGLFHTVSGLAALPGGLMAGLLWDRLGPTWAFVWGAVLALAAAALLAALKPTREPGAA